MSKGFMTPKAIGNRIKSKGLQKVRWYCEMCQKQCRDENGFKCHCTSESHRRQMGIFAANPTKIMDEFSNAFEEGYMEILSRRHRTVRMNANHVYQEYIQDKQHVHMNSTQWDTLGSFVQYLGRTGKVVADETEKGWFVKYIDRDPAAMARQEARAKKEKEALDDEERSRRRIAAQIRECAGRDGGGAAALPQASDLDLAARGATAEKVTLKIGLGVGGAGAGVASSGSNATIGDGGGGGGGGLSGAFPSSAFDALVPSSLAPAPSATTAAAALPTRKRSNMEELMVQGQQKKARAAANAAASAAAAAAVSASSSGAGAGAATLPRSERLDNWVQPGLVVKVMNKQLAGGQYYKRKGVVRRVVQLFEAELEMIDSGDVLKIDQQELETVLPKAGGTVLVVNGTGRGYAATMLELDIDHFCATVKLSEGPARGTVLTGVQYEDLCKLRS